MNQLFKIFLLLLLITDTSVFGQTLVSDSTSQITSKKESHQLFYKLFDIGLEGGINYLNYKPHNYSSRGLSIKQGTSFGLHFQFNYNKQWSLITNLYFEEKKREQVFYWNYKKETFHYITLPVMLKHSFGKKKLFYIDGGTFISALIKKTDQNMYYTETYKPNKIEFGGAVGLGIRIPITKTFDMTIDAKGYLGLFNLHTSTLNYATSTNYMVGINYKFGKVIPEKKIECDSVSELYATKKERKLFVKIFYSQQMTGNTMRGDHVHLEDAYYGNSHTSYYYDGNQDIPKSGQEFGILLEIRKRKNFNLNVGLTFDQLRFQTKETTLFYSGWGDLLGNYSGSVKNTKIQYKFDFFTVPIIFNYVHKAKKCNIYAGAGIGLKKIFHSNVSITTPSGKQSYDYKFGNETSTNKIDVLNLFSIANVGMDITFSKSVSLFIEPNFKYDLGKFNIPINDRPVKLWSAGCRIGIKF